jgi:hypothetical protein
MTEPAENPPTTLPTAYALPTPIIDVSTPDNWVIIVRPASAHFPDKQGKFGAEYWMAGAITRPDRHADDGGIKAMTSLPGEARSIGDVFESSPEDPEEILRHHHDVTQGMVGSGDGLEFDAAFFETVLGAADAAIKAARAQGAAIDEHLVEYIQILAREADTMREGLPPWADVVFKRDALEAMRRIGCRDLKVAFFESDEKRRRVDVEMVYRGELYEVSYEPDGEHDDERQDVILQAIRDLPARVTADRAAAAATE